MSVVLTFLIPLIVVGYGFLSDSRVTVIGGTVLSFIAIVLMYCLDQKKQSVSIAIGTLMPWIYFMATAIFKFQPDGVSFGERK